MADFCGFEAFNGLRTDTSTTAREVDISILRRHPTGSGPANQLQKKTS
jgi:hypothetical protein